MKCQGGKDYILSLLNLIVDIIEGFMYFLKPLVNVFVDCCGCKNRVVERLWVES